MLVFSRILYGMLLGVALIFVSELCLADQDVTPIMGEELTVSHQLLPLYEINERFSLVGTYKHYEDHEVDADRVFLGVRAHF